MFIKSVLGSEKYIYFSLLPELADLFSQFTPYIIDVLIKYKDKIEASEKKKIQEVFSLKIITSEYLPEYLIIAIVRLLGCEDYQDKKIFLICLGG